MYTRSKEKQKKRSSQSRNTERVVLFQSIKKSISKNVSKIDSALYKNILKGQYIFLHICYKGELNNAEYKNLISFMGGTISEKTITQKITLAVVNQTNSKMMKRLKQKNIPIVSVLWLQGCFNEKKKIEIEDFLWNEQKSVEEDEESDEMELYGFDYLIQSFKSHAIEKAEEYQRKNKPQKVRFLEKKEKISLNYDNIILQHQIEIGGGGQRRKSQAPKKKRVQKDNECTSERSIHSQVNNSQERKVKTYHVQKSNKRAIFEKYLKEPFNFKTEETQQEYQLHTPPQRHTQKIKYLKQTESVKKYKVQSLRKQKQVISFCCLSKQIQQKIYKTNSLRKQKDLKEIEMVLQKKKEVMYVTTENKMECLQAAIQRPSIILKQQILFYLEDKCNRQISEQTLKKFQRKYELNETFVWKKNIIFTDSVQKQKQQILTQIANKLGANVMNIYSFLLKKTPDLIICNRKKYISYGEKTINEQSFIDNLIKLIQ